MAAAVCTVAFLPKASMWIWILNTVAFEVVFLASFGGQFRLQTYIIHWNLPTLVPNPHLMYVASSMEDNNFRDLSGCHDQQCSQLQIQFGRLTGKVLAYTRGV